MKITCLDRDLIFEGFRELYYCSISGGCGVVQGVVVVLYRRLFWCCIGGGCGVV